MLIEPYGCICRSHPEVEQYKEKLAAMAKKAEEKEKWAKAQQFMDKIMWVAKIRTAALHEGLPSLLVAMVLEPNIPEAIRDEVMREVKEQGDMTVEEAVSALISFGALRKAAGK